MKARTTSSEGNTSRLEQVTVFLERCVDLDHRTAPPWQPRAIVHPVPVRHTFGGVVFEECGIPSPTKKGEWHLALLRDRAVLALWDAPDRERQPVRPVEVVQG